MPIKPENKHLYPDNWHEIVARIRKRSGGRCEFEDENGNRCEARQYKPHPITGARVVLTVAHLDHIPQHCEDDNLRDACQRCHNRYDAGHRQETRRKTKEAMLNAGQGQLF
jgi:hypothetical protein